MQSDASTKRKRGRKPKETKVDPIVLAEQEYQKPTMATYHDFGDFAVETVFGQTSTYRDTESYWSPANPVYLEYFARTAESLFVQQMREQETLAFENYENARDAAYLRIDRAYETRIAGHAAVGHHAPPSSQPQMAGAVTTTIPPPPFATQNRSLSLPFGQATPGTRAVLPPPQTPARRAKPSPQRTSTHTARTQIAAASPGSVENYNSDLSDAIPIETKWPPNIMISMVELLAFAPNHFQVPMAGHRALCNNWTQRIVVAVQLDHRGRLNQDTFSRAMNRIKYQVRVNEDIVLGTTRFAMTKHGDQLHNVPSGPKDTSLWVPRPHVVAAGDPLLTEMAVGVTRMPAGDDRWHLTQAIEYALRNPHLQLRLSDVPQIVARFGLQLPLGLNMATCDQQAAARHVHLHQAFN